MPNFFQLTSTRLKYRGRENGFLEMVASVFKINQSPGDLCPMSTALTFVFFRKKRRLAALRYATAHYRCGRFLQISGCNYAADNVFYWSPVTFPTDWNSIGDDWRTFVIRRKSQKFEPDNFVIALEYKTVYAGGPHPHELIISSRLCHESQRAACITFGTSLGCTRPTFYGNGLRTVWPFRNHGTTGSDGRYETGEVTETKGRA